MKQFNYSLFPLIAFLFAFSSVEGQIFPNLGGQRAGISAMTFLKNDLSARSIAMGGASIALKGDAFAMAVNPAGGVGNSNPLIGLSSRSLAPGIYQSYLTAIYPTANREAFMVSLNYLGSGAQKRRTEFQPFGDGSVYNADAFKIGVGYSKSLSKMFSFGANINFVREQLATYSANAASVDLGFLYQTDWKALSFAVGLQHFGVNSTLNGSDLPVTYNRSGTVSKDSYGAPTLFSMGLSMIPYQENEHQILVSAQLNHPNDNAENIRIGVQYRYDSLFYFRAGYRLNVPGEIFSGGIGMQTRFGAFPFNIEFAVVPNRYLGILYSVGLNIGFIKVGQ